MRVHAQRRKPTVFPVIATPTVVTAPARRPVFRTKRAAAPFNFTFLKTTQQNFEQTFFDGTLKPRPPRRSPCDMPNLSKGDDDKDDEVSNASVPMYDTERLPKCQATRHLDNATRTLAVYDMDTHKYCRHRTAPISVRYNFPKTDLKPVNGFTSNYKKIMDLLLEKASVESPVITDQETSLGGLSSLRHGARRGASCLGGLQGVMEEAKDSMLHQLQFDMLSTDNEMDVMVDDMRHEFSPILTHHKDSVGIFEDGLTSVSVPTCQWRSVRFEDDDVTSQSELFFPSPCQPVRIARSVSQSVSTT